MSDLTRLTAVETAAVIAAGQASAVEVAQAHLDRIAAVDGDVHAFLHVSDHALEVAADIDRRRAAGEQLGELAGVPLAVKDVLVTTDMPSTSGSNAATSGENSSNGAAASLSGPRTGISR